MAAIATSVGILGISALGVRLFRQCYRLEEDVTRLNDDEVFREQVVQLASTELPSVDGSTVKAAVRDITVGSGYDISGVLEEAARTAVADLTPQWWQTRGVANVDIVQFAGANRVVGAVRPIPRFVAACVVELRARYGVMSSSDANVLVIQDRYIKLCKTHHVRQIDVARHRQLVINLFFSSYLDFDIAHARRRAPQWLLTMRDWFSDEPYTHTSGPTAF